MKSTHLSSCRRTAILLVAASLSWAPAYSQSSSKALPNFQKVNDHIYRGGQPTNEGFKALANIGVKVVIDLRDIGEHSQAGEEQVVKYDGMQYVSVPMKGLAAPSKEALARVLSYFDDESTGPVFVHCRRGADRTGTVIAVYRIRHDGWENQKALSEAKGYGMSMFERAMQHYVMAFRAPPPEPALKDAAAPDAGH